MNAQTIDFTQFGKDINAYTMVFDNLVRKIQEEIEKKNTINKLCTSIEIFSALIEIADSQLKSVRKEKEIAISFPVEIAINIRDMHVHTKKGFVKIISILEAGKPSFYHRRTYKKLIKKVKETQKILMQLLSTVESMSSYDEWDAQMYADTSSGKLDNLLNDIENEYLAGDIRFN